MPIGHRRYRTAGILLRPKGGLASNGVVGVAIGRHVCDEASHGKAGARCQDGHRLEILIGLGPVVVLIASDRAGGV